MGIVGKDNKINTYNVGLEDTVSKIAIFFAEGYEEIEALAAPQLLLFDYRERNPLTQDARVVSLSC